APTCTGSPSSSATPTAKNYSASHAAPRETRHERQRRISLHSRRRSRLLPRAPRLLPHPLPPVPLQPPRSPRATRPPATPRVLPPRLPVCRPPSAPGQAMNLTSPARAALDRITRITAVMGGGRR